MNSITHYRYAIDTKLVTRRQVMTPKQDVILGLLQTYNGEKYLYKAMDSLTSVCDVICVLDDGSTDSTPLIISRYPKVAITYTMPKKDIEWTMPDSELRNISLRMADKFFAEKKSGWCVSLDDDEEFEDPSAVRKFILKDKPNAASFHFLHMWDRLDLARHAGHRIRAWRWSHGDKVEIGKRFHCGSSPSRSNVIHRMDLRVIHWGLFDAADRQKQYEMYNRVDPGGKDNRNPYTSLIKPVRLSAVRLRGR